ncbi:hypothetical protein KAW64_01995 [bacterium]|nr:hypothetical protein [bacterium]
MAGASMKDRERKAEAVDLICSRLAAGEQPSTIKPDLAKYDAAERTVSGWIKDAYTRLGKEAGLLRQSYLGRSLSRLEFLWRWAVSEGDRAECRKIEKDIREMLGLNEAVEIRHLIPDAWHQTFDEMGIRIPGNGANGGKDESPQVRH